MAVSLRLSDEKVAALDALAASRGVSRSDLIEQGVDLMLSSPTAPPAPIRLSKSQRECLAQLAERAGMDTGALMTRWIAERLRREFVDDRNRLLQDISHNGRQGAKT